MRLVHQSDPQDVDAAVLFAEALMDLGASGSAIGCEWTESLERPAQLISRAGQVLASA